MSVHIAAEKKDIASVVLMPGDPLRAKYIATKYLNNVKIINTVRNMFGYTGIYKNKKVTIFPSGMGMPSIGIYAHELFNEYDVKKIIRIGSCGAYNSKLKLRDVILVDEAFTDSNFAKNYNSENIVKIKGNTILNKEIIAKAKNKNIVLHKANILSTETFYSNNKHYEKFVNENNCMAVEMEAFALFCVAKTVKKVASCLLTVSDCVYPNNYGELNSQEREQSLDEMIILALESM